ncbi:MAG: hypothetical protein ABIA92_01025 [Patescibacteria group bacterium]
MRKILSKIRGIFVHKRSLDEEFYEWTKSGVKTISKFWFQLLGWLAIIGTLEYLREETGHIAAWIFLAISVLMIGLHVQIPVTIFFERILKKHFSYWWYQIIALFITVIICTALFLMMRSLVIDIANLNVI